METESGVRFRFPDQQMEEDINTETVCRETLSSFIYLDDLKPRITSMSRCTDWNLSLWRDTFDELLNDDDELDYGDPWTLNFNPTLIDTVTKGAKKRGWKIYSYCAHGHFRCASCRRTWPSARVTVLFHYRLRSNKGTVLMRPYGQACRSCEDSSFYLPGFSQKDIEVALLWLFSKIRKNCYGEEDINGNESHPSTKAFTKPHEKDLCEACNEGTCCQGDD